MRALLCTALLLAGVGCTREAPKVELVLREVPPVSVVEDVRVSEEMPLEFCAVVFLSPEGHFWVARQGWSFERCKGNEFDAQVVQHESERMVKVSAIMLAKLKKKANGEWSDDMFRSVRFVPVAVIVEQQPRAGHWVSAKQD